MTPRRELGIAVLMTLAGAGLVLIAAGRSWVSISARPSGLVATTTAARGAAAGVVRSLGLAALAGVAGIAAARGRGRIAVGLVLALAGAGAATLAIAAGSRPTPVSGQQSATPNREMESTAWPWVAASGGVIVAAAGVLVTLRGTRWSALPQRYAGAAATVTATRPVEATDAGLWDAQSRGDDPT